MKPLRRIPPALLMLAVGLASAGCAPGQRPPPVSVPNKGETVGPIPLDGVSPLPASTYDVAFKQPVISHGIATGVLAVDGSGTVLLSERRHNPTDQLAMPRPTLELRAAGLGGVVEIPEPRRMRPQQTTRGALTGRWAVWTEEPDTELGVAPWVMYAYDREARTTIQVARAPKIDGHQPPAVPGYTGPTISGDRVFWAQAEGRVGAETANIYGCVIASCAPTRYATAAAYPVAVGDDLYVIARDAAAGPKDLWERMEIKRIDIETKEATVVEAVEFGPAESPGGLAVSERAVAWIVDGRPDVMVIRDLTTGVTTTVESELEGSFGYPVATDRFVVWGESMGNSPANVGNYLYLLDERTLHSLGNTSGLYGVDAAGSYISWRDSTDPALPTVENIRVTLARIKDKE